MQEENCDNKKPLPIITSSAFVNGRQAGTSSAAQLLQRSLNTFLEKDVKGWAELCDVNVVVEFPFAPDKTSRRMVGRMAIYEYLKDYADVIDLRAVRMTSIHATEDPDLAIAEWSVSGQVLANGNPYEMSYATFATFKNDLIINYREYWNPFSFIAAMHGTMF